MVKEMKKDQAIKVKKGSKLPFVLICCLIFSLFVAVPAKRAQACCSCFATLGLINPGVWRQAEEAFDQKINDEFLRLERFIVHEMWEQSILPAMMLSAEQFTAVAMQQVMIIGTFFDARQQLETQRLLQVLQAKAHKDYVPSVGMCNFGSMMKSISTTERKSEYNAVLLSQRSLDRQLGNAYSSGTYGNDLDQGNRIKQFAATYCNEKDRNGAMWSVCSAMAPPLPPDKSNKIDRDIDYFVTIDSPWTIKMDFTNTSIKSPGPPPIDNVDEEDVMALAANLFAHNNFPRPPARLLVNVPDQPLSEMQQAYLQLRSIVAKRSVAENSYNAIAAMKSEGHRIVKSGVDSPMSADGYLKNVMIELGLPVADIDGIVGGNLSYYAQMEILTKKIYQNPDFYTELYDTPANVKRKTVALEAIKLMQKFDLFKSFLRNEASFSVLLELAVYELQNEVEDQIDIADTSEAR